MVKMISLIDMAMPQQDIHLHRLAVFPDVV